MTLKSFLLTTAATALFAMPTLAEDSGTSSKPQGPMGQGFHGEYKPKPNSFWWPDQLDLTPLRDHDKRSNPMGADFDYKAAFEALDLDAVKADVAKALTDEQDWWPADWGNYGPLFVRMTWHAAGTYRTLDGRGGADGGQQRFEPTASWPDNGNLDKARRILWPVKQKYGASLSWGDLIVLAGTHGMEEMGFKIYGFAGGRTDDWEPDLVYWGPEVEMLASDREDRDGKLQRPLGAIHMGLIYVNPQGPKGVPDPLASAKNIRVSFGRMAMNDEETVALVAGGHTFGKMHGAVKPDCVGADPAGAPIEQQGLGWKNSCGKGHSEDTMTSGFEGAWTQAPIQWTNLYLENLMGFEWEQTTTPAGAIVWVPTDKEAHSSVPDAHVEGKYNPPVMTTADLALKFDPEYRKITERFRADPEEFRLAYAKAWYKLTHRDMGPRGRFLQDSAPADDLIWTDPVPAPDYKTVSEKQIKALKEDILDAGLSVSDLVHTAWASASSFRAADKRGGANGARIRLAPMKDWAANNSEAVTKVLSALEGIQSDFNGKSGKAKVSMADLIVLGGAAAIEKAASDAGMDISVPFAPGRGDATQDMTDTASYGLLEPSADAFRNFYHADKAYRPALEMLIDRADQLNLTVPEMTALIGGLRVLGANTDGAHGVLTDRVGVLSTDFFRTLLDMKYEARKAADGSFEIVERGTDTVAYTATDVDLVFGAHSELRTVAEVYAYDGAEERFAEDFVNAWVKVMQLDRFDLKHDL